MGGGSGVKGVGYMGQGMRWWGLRGCGDKGW